ncbi:MFS general substrate transporter [Rhizopus microsporus var. microsporus]|uniref:MFS general substrate transporter n=1 Tax=Rhizopus microsporus var. microsporus TaxID=86635 RepID=A0A1X0R371_RHIZD|nr:MFS general substrate transporter [Rhizopus microsporus var. microsporus]
MCIVDGFIVCIHRLPFIVDAIDQGMTPDVTASNLYQSLSTSITDSVSRKSSTLLIMFSVGTIVGSVIFGYLGDKVNHRRPLLMFSVFWLVLSTVLFMFGNVLWMLQLARLIQGLSNSCIWIMGMCLIVDTFPTNKVGKQAGIIVAAHSFGFLIGPPVGALFQTTGYKAPLILCMALNVPAFIMQLLLIEHKKNAPECAGSGRLDDISELTFSTVDSERSMHVDQEHSIKTEKEQRMTYLKLFQQNRLLNATLMALLQGFVTAGLENSLTIRLASEWKYTSGQIGLIFIARVIPTFISAPFAGIIADRYGSKVVVCPFWLLSAAAIVLIGIPSKSTIGGIVPLVVLIATLGFSMVAAMTPVQSEIACIVRSHNEDGKGDNGMSRSYGLFNIAYAVGGIIGPLTSGYLYSVIGFFWLCVIMGCTLLLFAPYVFISIGGRRVNVS